MHYRDGTLAKVGDIVRGKGYNVKDEQGNLKEIVGVMVRIKPGTSCNCEVAHTIIGKPIKLPAHASKFVQPSEGVRWNWTEEGIVPFTAGLEYGQCDHFELIARAVAVVETPDEQPALV